ncbi:hypothetical protein CYLTODRAFT_416619 [Cylindrobasidium torrendii FP15055 ss-10]|uniref:HIG1 domain-containing protein n=1 Tax=Cylindrobasidium torrendii FP15055 ss-10 TaxID=1314674 RepID=A0A0D7BWF7_9AGAR|nr:hypothetical protein CYLTODRAFT_416619 [Cylindrobasidium torrendii FP15055 ss-10]
MKLLTDEQLATHEKATVRGGIEGALIGAGIGIPLTLWASRRYPVVKALPPHLKALGIIIFVAPGFAIQAERRGLEYDRSQWQDDMTKILDDKEAATELAWERMTFSAKAKDWALRHEWTIILGGWAASMGVAGGIIARDRLQSPSQKVVQARMWAQALTVALVIGASAFKASQGSKQGRVVDHSWRDVLEQQERARIEDEQSLKVSPSSEARQLAEARA